MNCQNHRMFKDFTRFDYTVAAQGADMTLRGRWGGSGPPLLLLHGHPQWHALHRYPRHLHPRHRAQRFSGRSLPCGHYIAEEAPELLLPEIFDFFKEPT